MVASLTPVPEGAVPPEPVNILLVDDQPGRLLTYRAILEPLGERLVEASSGMDALKRLMEEEFALILLDVNMPGMDGFETASMIHQHPRYEKTPIIFVTAVNVTDMDRLKGYKLGAVDYVMVPVIPEILRSKVVVLVELFRKRRELQFANERLAAANEALQLEKAQELERLNESLREANTELATRNRELQIEIGERARVERQLIAADLRKDEFLATLAHELRNPLAPLRNALHIRRLSARDEDGDDPLQRTMERQLGLLVRLIDDLLDVARITRGKLALRPRETTLRRVLEAAVETATPVIEAGGHELSVELPDQDVPMLVDDERLSQVFANLLNNAAKYSDARGRIELHARADAREACVAVRDSGIGLTGDQIANIFELFSQVDTAIERARGGLGIGLTLVQQLTEMHGGRVEVHSDGLGRGSEFRVCLPLRVPGATTPRADSASREQAPGCARTRCRALVVDDNRDSADTLAMMIELLGHEVRRAYDPQEVEALVAEYRPELVFLDVGMPGLSGYDLARVLRAGDGGDRMMLVAVTGWGQPEDRRRTREAGFDRHLVKPVELDEIRAICLDPARPQAPA